MIRLLRRLVANFFDRNDDLNIGGIPLSVTILDSGISKESFLSNVVLKDKEEARSGIHAVIPMVLRISLTYVCIDPDSRNNVSAESLTRFRAIL